LDGFVEVFDEGDAHDLGVFVVRGDELDVFAEGVDMPAHELGDGLCVLTPGVAVGFGSDDGAPAWYGLLGVIAHEACPS
jgi:hypothetical protein